MLITPSGKDKNSLTCEDIAEVDLSTGENLTPEFKLSIETEMHRSVYLERADVNSVVHSHPTCCCLFSASEEKIDISLIAESWYLFGGRVDKAPYRLMGTKALADVVAEYVKLNANNIYSTCTINTQKVIQSAIHDWDEVPVGAAALVLLTSPWTLIVDGVIFVVNKVTGKEIESTFNRMCNINLAF